MEVAALLFHRVRTCGFETARQEWLSLMEVSIMKIYSFILPLASIFLFSAWAMAQSVDVKKIDADEEGSTTIRIEKNKNPNAITATTNKWELQDGTADVEGEASASAKDAKKAWLKACNEWKKEFREDNKENKVLNLNCGVSNCGGEAGSKICSSKATYKIKTRVD